MTPCKHIPTPRKAGLTAAIAVAFACLSCPPWAAAQKDENTVVLTTEQSRLLRVATDVFNASATFNADSATTVISVEIVSSVELLATQIMLPGGQLMNATNFSKFGAEYAEFQGGEDPPDSAVVISSDEPGFHYIYAFPTQGAGSYEVQVTAVDQVQDEAVIVDFLTDSPVISGVFTTQPTLTAGAPSVVVAAIFETATPVTGATAMAYVKPPTGAEIAVTMLDDGMDPDDAVGDGLYSGQFTTSELGAYDIVGEMSGVSPGGISFSRIGATKLFVVEPGATLTGTLTDQGADDDANGLFDRVLIDVQADVDIAGTYAITVVLETAGGQTLLGHGQDDLLEGTQLTTAEFTAAQFIAAGEDGPYTITDVELDFIAPEGAFPADFINDGTQLTRAYTLSQFDRPAIALTGVNSDTGIDFEPDGAFDVLEVRVGIEVQTPGFYDYSVRLVDSCGGEIEFTYGFQQFPSGESPERLLLQFSGGLIGANGVDGPYMVQDLLMFGPGGSLVATTVAETQAYMTSQWFGFTGPQDCNANGVPDLCDLVDGTSVDCDVNLIPDECEPDCNANGITDACDISAGTSLDCNANGVPDECDLASGTSQDCNADGIPDDCQTDCNANGLADECDIASGTSNDCNANAIPDECENDCNTNGIADECDIASGTSTDCNTNGIPDECELAGNVTLYAVSHDGPELYSIDVSALLGARAAGYGGGPTVDATVVGTMDQDVSFGLGLAIHPATRQLFAIVDRSGGGPVRGEFGRFLATVDRETAAVTIIGQVPDGLADISFRDDGTLYGVMGNNAVNPGEIVTVSLTDAATASTGIVMGAGGGQSIAFHPTTGLLYHYYSCCPVGSASTLSKINVNTAMVTTIATYPFAIDPHAIAFHPAGLPFVEFSQSGMVEVDPDSGIRTDIGFPPITVTGAAFFAPGADCNTNGVLDECDIAAGTSTDCDGNGVPDECQPDCNANGIADACDIASGASNDCNGSGVPDECEIAGNDCNANGIPDDCETDCNANGVPDDCDLAGGTSQDCDANGVPDECDPDCNLNGIPDACDIAGGTSNDCNGDGIPDECDDDCNNNGVADGCDIAAGTSEDCNNNAIPDECEIGGDPSASQAQDACADAEPACPGFTYTGSTVGSTNDGSAGCASSGGSPDVWYAYTPGADGTLTVSLCGSAYDTALSVHSGCPGTTANELVCNDDSCGLQSQITLSVTADTTYLIRVAGYGGSTGSFTMTLTGPDCASLGAGDCNANGVPDDCDVASGSSQDVNGNAIPDECEPDCNANGVPDGWDISTGASGDCNANDIPDECDIASGTSADTNGSGVPDECEDCNGNGVTDDVDIAGGTSQDCNGNGTPNECETDCNGNGAADECDVASGSSADCNANGVPDECELTTSSLLNYAIPVNPPIPFSESTPPATHTFFAPDDGVILDVNVGVTLNHTYVNDLIIQVEHLGVQVVLFSHECSGEDNFSGTVFDDEAAGPIACVAGHAGTFTPFQLLSAFDGLATGGNWTLTVTDTVGGDSGTLLGWSLQIDNEGLGHDCNANGVLDECDIASGFSQDCNANGAPDDCDIAAGTSLDANTNGIPDECEPSCAPPILTGARSIATHDTGEYYVDLDITGNPATRTSEPRSAGIQVLDFGFDQPILGGSVTVAPGGATAPIAPGAGTFGANGGRADLGAGLANDGVYTITISATTGPGCDLTQDICVVALVGDFDDNDVVNASDKGTLVGFIGQTVSQTNARFDVSVGGAAIDAGDLGFWTGFFGATVVGEGCP